jgi:hypothetical protein
VGPFAIAKIQQVTNGGCEFDSEELKYSIILSLPPVTRCLEHQYTAAQSADNHVGVNLSTYDD